MERKLKKQVAYYMRITGKESILGLASPDGFLERNIQATEWPLPDKVEIDGKFLYWEAFDVHDDVASASLNVFGVGREFSRYAMPARGMLEDFLKLENAAPARIAAYAKKWGILDVGRVRDSRPGSRKEWRINNSAPTIEEDDITLDRVRFYNWHQLDEKRNCFYGYEPLYVWRYWSKQFSAALRACVALRNQKAPDSADWARLLPINQISRANAKIKDNRERIAALGDIVSDDLREELDDLRERVESDAAHPLLNLASDLILRCMPKMFEVKLAVPVFYACLIAWQKIARVDLAIDPIDLRLTINTHCLFSGLVLQLLTAVSRTSGGVICAGCDKFFTPLKRRPPGRRSYCIACRRAGVPVRDAVRDLRSRRTNISHRIKRKKPRATK